MKLICPVGKCQAENDVQAETCERCGTPLRGYARLSVYPNRLFNRGISSAREGDIRRARDFFSAVICWCPMDSEARNALALACFELKDFKEAQCQWTTVLERKPADTIATKGLLLIRKSQAKKKSNPSKKRSRRKK